MKSDSDSTSAKYSVFFLKNAQHNTKSLEVYLERRDFTVQTANTIEVGFKKINENRPSYVFAAWDHVDSTIQEIMTEVPEECLVIPYITSTSNSDARKLMTVNAPLKMFPPLTGPAIQRLILKYEKEKHQLKSNNQSITQYKKDYSGESQTYVNKGDHFKDMNAVISNRSLNGTEDSTSVQSETDFNSVDNATRFSPGPHVKISEVQKQGLKTKFEDTIKEELKEIIETAKEITTSEHLPKIFCILVQSVDCSGLILLNTAWNLNLEDAQSALSKWADELTAQHHKNENSKNIYQSEVFSVENLSDLNVFDICQSQAAVQKEIIIDEKNTTMAFFDLEHNPFNLQNVENSHYLSIDFGCIQQNAVLTFDLFFQLKENKKMLKIFKKEASLSEKEINSISEKKLLPLLISKTDEILWYKYGVEAYLKNL